MKPANSSLASPPANVARPAYDRTAVKTGIIHFGVGGFHRAHQAMYLDTLMNAGLALDQGICGVGIMPRDLAMRDALRSQDCLYTLVTKHPDGRHEARVIGSIVECLYAPDDPPAVIEKMADPAIRIVSLTITEGGYNFHHDTGEFNLDDPGVRHDLQPDAIPKTVFGLVTEALRLRWRRGIPAFTLLSCDNIQGNGDIARRMLLAYADAKDASLATWIGQHTTFPNCMVDRITPVTTDADRADLLARTGIEDACPVVCEPFAQWVLEDHFANGRPPYEKTGVQLVADVIPYELMKLRLLNASHQALCYLGYLSGYRYAHEVAQDPAFIEFLLGYMDDEGTPTLRPVPGIDLAGYKRTLIARFANPEIKDTLARLCAESSDRIPKWLLPVIRENLAAGGPIARSAAVVASWARYVEGTDEQGQPINVIDRLADQLTAIAAGNRTTPASFIENRALFGELAENARFRAAYLDALHLLHTEGARATVEHYRHG